MADPRSAAPWRRGDALEILPRRHRAAIPRSSVKSTTPSACRILREHGDQRTMAGHGSQPAEFLSAREPTVRRIDRRRCGRSGRGTCSNRERRMQRAEHAVLACVEYRIISMVKDPRAVNPSKPRPQPGCHHCRSDGSRPYLALPERLPSRLLFSVHPALNRESNGQPPMPAPPRNETKCVT